uniref:Late embryogenesis abundant protein LEA-2 subgroup domain-containing protein n=1 Tax=Oryza meridionalis TaxID=40149 RepID=A0A0E0DQN0_9ORYZ
MAEHHLPPEPADERHHHNHGGKAAVHADDLKPGGRRRRRYGYYYGGGDGYGAADPARTLCFVVLVVILLAGITALVLYLVYRPSRPAFAVTSVAVYSLSLNGTGPAGPGAGAPATLAASFQLTLVIRNPNGRSAARYDRLAAYVAYRGEPITAPAPMPPLVQDADSAVAVAPVLGAGAAAPPVPVSPDTAAALATDVSYGVVALRVVVLGRVRFVSGPFRSGWHSMYARCDLLVGVRKSVRAGGGAGAGPEAPLLGNPTCAVDM